MKELRLTDDERQENTVKYSNYSKSHCVTVAFLL